MKKLSGIALLAVATICWLAPTASGAEGDGGGTDIIGGSPTTIEQWPWQVAIEAPGAGSAYDRQRCGGSLISPTTVLTAAHCFFNDSPSVQAFRQPSERTAITGRTTLSSSAGLEQAITDVIYFVDVGGRPTPQSVTQPPAGPRLYNDPLNKWDVAVVELAAPAPGPAAPIEIADSSERGLWDAGDPVTATGWGARSTVPGLPNYADQLEGVEMNVISDADCGDSNSYFTLFDPALMVCAGNPPTGGEDTCQGDSGGPLVAAAGDGTYRLVGVTSFGIGCGDPERWGVYARAADTTMRPAIMESIQLTPGGPGTPELDRTSPTAKFGKAPKKKTTKPKAKFTFSASEPSTFTCALDKAKAKACESPYKAKVKPGKHKLVITATDSVGNVSAAETYKWKVKKKRQKRR